MENITVGDPHRVQTPVVLFPALSTEEQQGGVWVSSTRIHEPNELEPLRGACVKICLLVPPLSPPASEAYGRGLGVSMHGKHHIGF